MTPHRFLALAVIAALVPAVAVAQSGRVNVQIDQTQRVQLGGAVGSVIVANPLIADVTVVDANTLFIIGRGYGVTQVVAVDQIGRTVYQSDVVVTGGSTGAVRVWRGAKATEMACSTSCSVNIRSAEPTIASPAAAPAGGGAN